MAIDKLNIPNKTDNAAKKKMVQSNTIGANETLLANEVNALVAKTNELVDAYNFGAPITAFNFKENVATYADLASIVDPQKDDAYGVLADGLIYIYNGESWPTEGNGLDLKLRPTGKVAEGVEEAVSGGEVFNKTMKKDIYLNTVVTRGKNLFNKNAVLLNSQISTTGRIITVPDTMVSNPIYVEEGKYYTVSGGFSSSILQRISFFENIGDLDPHTYIQGSYTVQSPITGYMYVGVSSTTTDNRDRMQVEEGQTATEYTPYVPDIISEKIKEEYLPEGPQPSIDLADINLHINQSVVFDKDEFEENKTFYDSIRKLQGGSNTPHEVTINIPNDTGQVLNDVIVPINVHRQSQGNISGYRHVFFNGNINADFSDLRAFVGDEMVDMNIVSSGNYSAIPHGLPRRYLNIQQVGDTWFGGRGYNTDISLDFFETTETIFENVEFAFADAEKNIYGKIQGQNDLTKFYFSTNYTTSKVVIVPPSGLSESIWRLKNLVVDKFGHMYLGAYQETVSPRVYKSTDMGETWTMIFTPDMVGSQHVHNIICDISVEPNKIYLSFDGSIKNEELRQSQWTSVDYGATWQRDDHRPKIKGFDVDNGVMYAESGKLVCGGEAAIKYCPGLYVSKNDEATFDIKLWGQNVHLASKIGDLYIASGTNYVACKESDIWGSYDLDKWFRINQIINLDASVSGTGNGYRYGSYVPIKDGEGNDCIILVANDLQNAGFRSPILKLMTGGDYYSALVHVRIPTLPIGGATVTFKNNYAVSEPKRNLFNRDIQAKYTFPLNERVDKLEYAETVETPKWHYKFDSYGINLEGQNTVPYSKKGLIKMSDFGIDIPAALTSSFSVSFWYGYPYDADFSNNNYSLIQVGNVGVRFGLGSRVAVNIAGSEFYVTNIVKLDSMHKPSLCTVVFDRVENSVSIYIDNNLQDKSNRDLTPVSVDRIKAGFKTPNINQLGYISDLRVFDFAFTTHDVNKLFNKSDII